MTHHSSPVHVQSCNSQFLHSSSSLQLDGLISHKIDVAAHSAASFCTPLTCEHSQAPSGNYCFTAFRCFPQVKQRTTVTDICFFLYMKSLIVTTDVTC